MKSVHRDDESPADSSVRNLVCGARPVGIVDDVHLKAAFEVWVEPGLRRTWDLMPDGKQFVMLFRGRASVGVIANWADLLAVGR